MAPFIRSGPIWVCFLHVEENCSSFERASFNKKIMSRLLYTFFSVPSSQAGRCVYSYSTHTYLPMKMEQTKCSKTSAYKLQTPGNYPEESIQPSEHGESLKSRMIRLFQRYEVDIR